MMHTLTMLQIGIPIFAAIFLFLARFRREAVVSWIAIFVVAANSFLWGGTAFLWVRGGFLPVSVYYGSLIRFGDYGFDVIFQVDTLTVAFTGLVAFISGIVVKYSQYYMHRESGYTRFFVNILIFLGGINLLGLAGTLDLLFAGWEIVGISSFLLIAFYRERLQPTRHAVRTYTIYRFCDTGLLLGAWLSHLVWNASPTFSDLGSEQMLVVLQNAGEMPLLGLGLLVLLAASGKSAQFPFTFWIPRAMEGPTPSSAIFYGALSIHAGVFLLLRMFPVWHSSYYAPFAVGVIGGITAIVSTLVGQTQSNIKGQIAYASAAQVGLMFVELALGWTDLALFHMLTNGLLRCFQLLVSPSIMAFVLRRQGEGGGKISSLNASLERLVPKRWVVTLYVFCLNEAYLEAFSRTLFWGPVRWIGEVVGRLSANLGSAVPLLLILGVGVSMASRDWAAGILVVSSVAMSSFALASTGRPARAWDAATVAGIAMASSIALVDHEAWLGAILVSTSCFVGWLLGRVGLSRLEQRIPGAKLNDYHGLVKVDPLAATLLFLGFLFEAGFPIAPGFIGEDLLMYSTVRVGEWATVLLGLVFVFTGIALVRIFARVSFAGHHKEPLRWEWESSQSTLRRHG